MSQQKPLPAQRPKPEDVVRVYASLAERLPACVKLWLYIRWLDSADGSGVATTSISDLMSIFNLKRQCIKLYLRRGLKEFNLYRRLKYIDKDKVKIFYTSALRVAKYNHITDFGAVGYVPIRDIGKPKIVATRLTTLRRQIQSQWHARYHAKINLRRGTRRQYETIKLSVLFEKASVNGSGELTSQGTFRGKRRILYLDQTFALFGTSQKSIGETLERHRITVNRRLRRDKKLQLAQSGYRSEWEDQREDQYNGFYFFHEDEYYRPLPNVYEFPDEYFITGVRFTRDKLNHHFDLPSEAKKGIIANIRREKCK